MTRGTRSPGIPGSLFLPPGALSDLRQGQIIDQDPQLHTICTVGFIARDPGGREIVMISERGDTFESNIAYDRTTGLAVALFRTQQVGVGPVRYIYSSSWGTSEWDPCGRPRVESPGRPFGPAGRARQVEAGGSERCPIVGRTEVRRRNNTII
jgi:hypothetical protein